MNTLVYFCRKEISMLNLNEPKIAIIGLGYVGLPLAVEFSKKYSTIGFDINKSRVNELNNGADSTLEVDDKALIKRITGRSTCGGCGQVYHDETKPWPMDGKCGTCGSNDVKRRADDNEEIAIKRYQMYEKNIDPVINFYKETNLLKVVNGETSVSEISDEISRLIEGIKG